MKSIIVNKVLNVYKVTDALKASGIHIITIRARGNPPLVQSAEIVLDDSVDVATAQAILDAFDPIVAQSEIEAEEAAEQERQAFLKLAKDKWLNEFIPLRAWARTKGYPN